MRAIRSDEAEPARGRRIQARSEIAILGRSLSSGVDTLSAFPVRFFPVSLSIRNCPCLFRDTTGQFLPAPSRLRPIRAKKETPDTAWA